MSELSALNQGKDEFAVWGGKFKPEQWHDFLFHWHWPEDKRWGVWEFVSTFQINKGELPDLQHIPLLERAELFGESGHLSTRRDGEWIYWHFVGEPASKVPDGYNNAENNYWTTHPDEKFRLSDKKRTMLLWGERVENTSRWHDDRVAWAKLEYPHVANPAAAKKKEQRAQASYKHFTRGGQVAFVWLTGLTEYYSEEVNHG